MQIDLKTMPFSRRNSTMAISWVRKKANQPEGLYLRAIHGDPKWGEVCRISLRDKRGEVPFILKATPERLILQAKSGQVEFIFAEASLLHFRATGVSVRLEMVLGIFDNALPLNETDWMISCFTVSTKFVLKARVGQLRVAAPWAQLKCKSIVVDYLGNEAGRIEGTVHEIADHVPVQIKEHSFEVGKENVKKEWEEWRSRVRGKSGQFAQTQDLAAYLNWSSIVEARGCLKRPAMLMSKNIMSNIWSWDHCFNAMAHCQSHPELSWDQFMIFSYQQAASGAIPDRMGDTAIVWDFCKPPVHGWALNWMLERGLKLTTAQTSAAYRFMAGLTEWWFNCRDFDGDGRPEYYHGNDSGWDNSTVFKNGGPIESPDLLAFLVIQMETLADLAARLKRPKVAKLWRGRSANLLKKLIEEYWNGDRFIAYGANDVKIVDNESLLLHLPLVLGKRLPAAIRRKMVSNLTTSGLITRHGLATEPPSSPLYENDGYWRGPIWAPPTLLIADGLWNMGETKLAAAIAQKFGRLCARSGFAENFDARSGEGLRDRSYTWTASVFLILAKHYSRV